MKSKLLILSLVVGLLGAGSVSAQVDPFGNMDTVVIVPVGEPADGQFRMDLYVYADEDLAGVTMGFSWTNSKIHMDSARASAEAVAGFGAGIFLYEKDVLDTTNFYQRFLFGGLSLFAPMPAATARVRWASYYFTATGWAPEDNAVFDTLTFNLGSQYLMVEWAVGSDIVPIFNGEVLSVGGEPSAGTIPTSFALDQNYPNPFNPMTTISFDLPSPSHVRLTVYNILGQEVATLVNEHRAPNSYTVSWDASAQASGVYFYKLEAGSFTETRKMMLLK